MRIEDLAGKSVLFWGAGREATAFVHAIRRFHIDLELTIADESGQPGRMVEDVEVVALSNEVLQAADVIVRTPGVSRYRPELNGLVSTTATNLWFAEPHAPVIAVTGTKGKSTTSSLITHLLNGLGVKAELAGNIGRSPLELLGCDQPDWWVLELSSYQCSDLQYSPNIGVLTNLSPEHLDWHGSYEHYVDDKLRLFANNPHGALDSSSQLVSIVNSADNEALRVASNLPSVVLSGTDSRVHVANGIVYLNKDELFGRDKLKLRGVHNEQLLCLALTAIAEAGIDLVARAEEIARVLPSFSTLPYRLNPVGEHNGVVYIDDSLSTTPVASIAAMEAYGGEDITLLAGGYDRGLEYDNLANYVAGHENVRVITMPDSGKRIATAIREMVTREGAVYEVDSLAEAFALAVQLTAPKGAVLLSPGAPSFGQFKDYAERGNAFAQLVVDLQKSS